VGAHADGFDAINLLTGKRTTYPWTRLTVCWIKHPVSGKRELVRRHELYPILPEHDFPECDFGRRYVYDVRLKGDGVSCWTTHHVITDLPLPKLSKGK
jgi:hypothetical protein